MCILIYSFKVEGISSGGDDGGISEEEREPVRNQLNLAIPEIVTGMHIL
jgi:hypothetical protein